MKKFYIFSSFFLIISILLSIIGIYSMILKPFASGGDIHEFEFEMSDKAERVRVLNDFRLDYDFSKNLMTNYFEADYGDISIINFDFPQQIDNKTLKVYVIDCDDRANIKLEDCIKNKETFFDYYLNGEKQIYITDFKKTLNDSQRIYIEFKFKSRISPNSEFRFWGHEKISADWKTGSINLKLGKWYFCDNDNCVVEINGIEESPSSGGNIVKFRFNKDYPEDKATTIKLSGITDIKILIFRILYLSLGASLFGAVIGSLLSYCGERESEKEKMNDQFKKEEDNLIKFKKILEGKEKIKGIGKNTLNKIKEELNKNG